MRFVFIHGAGCTGEVWEAQRRAFHESIAPSLPGHGTLGSPDTIEAFADAIERELENHDVGEAVLCGNSMGGAVALQLALRQNPRVRAIVLLDSGAKLRVAPAIFDALEDDFAQAARMLAGLFFADPTPERIEAAVTMMTRVGPEQTIRDFRACDAFDASGRLGNITIPTLAITGEQDTMTPPKFAQFIADRIPGAQARILAGTGHLAMIENPTETNAALRAFVTKIDPD
ncbi:MAG: alpha/beta fold hydrolase [Vulcanimicrobiaceae bacterium]